MLQCVEHAPLKVVVSIMIRYCENCPAPCSALRHQSINMVHTVCCQWLATDAVISNCKRSLHRRKYRGSKSARKASVKKLFWTFPGAGNGFYNIFERNEGAISVQFQPTKSCVTSPTDVRSWLLYAQNGTSKNLPIQNSGDYVARSTSSVLLNAASKANYLFLESD